MLAYTNARQIWIAFAICHDAQALAILYFRCDIELVLVSVLEEFFDRVEIAFLASNIMLIGSCCVSCIHDRRVCIIVPGRIAADEN